MLNLKHKSRGRYIIVFVVGADLIFTKGFLKHLNLRFVCFLSWFNSTPDSKGFQARFGCLSSISTSYLQNESVLQEMGQRWPKCKIKNVL